MARKSFILFVKDAAWCVGCAQGADQVVLREVTMDSTSSLLASCCESAKSLLDELGHRNEPIILAIPSPWCLCASISTEGLPRNQRRQAMLYRLEEKLPLAAEQVTAQFICAASHALGIATETSRIARIVEALESRGIVVQIIAPTALLMLQHEQSSADASSHVLLAAEESGVNLFEFSGRCLCAWRLLPCEAKAVRRDLQIIAYQRTSQESTPLRVKTIGLPASIPRMLASCSELEWIEQSSSTLMDDAAHVAARLLTGRMAPLINLRCDGLAASDPHRLIRKPLHAAMLATALLLISIILALNWRAQKYFESAERSDDAQREVYRQAIPKGQTPANPRMRLESEFRALRGRNGDSSELPNQASALTQLHRALVRLPSDLRFRVLDIRIDGARLTLEGQARTHSDADVVANALWQQRGFKVDPPRTEQMRDEKGVAFTISAVASEEPLVATTEVKIDN